jgi:hypothetical protein
MLRIRMEKSLGKDERYKTAPHTNILSKVEEEKEEEEEEEC